MARWQSKAQIEEQAMEAAKRRVVVAVKDQVSRLIATWDTSGYPSSNECEKAIGVLVTHNASYDALSKDAQYYVRAAAVQHFMDAGINTVLRKKFLQEKREREAAFKISSASRTIVEEGMFRAPMTSGEIVVIGLPPEEQRVLTCLSCEFIRAPRDMGQDDDGYYCKLAEPTDEEKALPAYQQAIKRIAEEVEREQARQKRVENQRAAVISEMVVAGHQTLDDLDEFWAGLNE